MNMSYCRFENTSKDLRDCVDALQDLTYNDVNEELSDTERYYAKRMYEQAKEYIENYEEVFPE